MAEMSSFPRAGRAQTLAALALALVAGCGPEEKKQDQSAELPGLTFKMNNDVVKVRELHGTTSLSPQELESGIERKELAERVKLYEKLTGQLDTLQRDIDGLLTGFEKDHLTWFVKNNESWLSTSNSLSACSATLGEAIEKDHLPGLHAKGIELRDSTNELAKILDPNKGEWLKKFAAQDPKSNEGFQQAVAIEVNVKFINDVLKHDLAQFKSALEQEEKRGSPPTERVSFDYTPMMMYWILFNSAHTNTAAATNAFAASRNQARNDFRPPGNGGPGAPGGPSAGPPGGKPPVFPVGGGFRPSGSGLPPPSSSTPGRGGGFGKGGSTLPPSTPSQGPQGSASPGVAPAGKTAAPLSNGGASSYRPPSPAPSFGGGSRPTPPPGSYGGGGG